MLNTVLLVAAVAALIAYAVVIWSVQTIDEMEGHGDGC